MKNKLIGLSLIGSGLTIICLFIAFGPFAKGLNVPDFIKGFLIGFGVIVGAGIVVSFNEKGGSSKHSKVK